MGGHAVDPLAVPPVLEHVAQPLSFVSTVGSLLRSTLPSSSLKQAAGRSCGCRDAHACLNGKLTAIESDTTTTSYQPVLQYSNQPLVT